MIYSRKHFNGNMKSQIPIQLNTELKDDGQTDGQTGPCKVPEVFQSGDFVHFLGHDLWSRVIFGLSGTDIDYLKGLQSVDQLDLGFQSSPDGL